jgi:hypothetical protein
MGDHINQMFIRYAVPATLIKKITVFWDFTPCNLIDIYQCFVRRSIDFRGLINEAFRVETI